MKIITWNLRRLHSPFSIIMVKSLVTFEKPAALLIQETKIVGKDLSKIKKGIWPQSSHFSQDAIGKSGGILLLWDDSQLNCTLEIISQSWTAVKAECILTNRTFFLINIYALQALDMKRNVISNQGLATSSL